VSSDGQTVLVGTRRGNIIVVDPSVQEPLGEFHVVGSPIRCLSISPDGQLAAFTQISQPTHDTVVHLWSITERQLVGKVRVPGSVDRRDLAEQELVRVISWEKSANTIIVGFHTGRIVAIDLAAGHKRSTNRE
jgi:WD40 repeat protein